MSLDPTPHLPHQCAIEAYRFWRARSGQRYLFSIVSPHLALRFHAAVAILIDPRRQMPDNVLWLGTLDGTPHAALPCFKAAADAGLKLHVHLLAQTQEAQFAVLQDLSHTFSRAARLSHPRLVDTGDSPEPMHPVRRPAILPQVA